MNRELAIKILKVVALTLVIFAVLMVLANVGYFWQNLRYDLGYREVLTSQAPIARPNFLTIPALGIAAPITFAAQPDETSFQAALLNGVAHYPGTALPGQPGNCYIFGHSSDFPWSKGHYKTIFSLLPKIKIGNTINVTDAQGNLFTYIVKSTAIVDPSDVAYLKQDPSQKLLTVQTSWPVGTALKRFLAVAVLKQT